MLLGTGAKVVLHRTGQTATVKKLLGNGMVLVVLDKNNLEIPVFESDLRRIDLPSQGASVSKGTQPRSPKDIPPSEKVASAAGVAAPAGLSIAFLPEHDNEGLPVRYGMFLINESPYTAALAFRIFFDESKPHKWDGAIPPGNIISIGYLLHDQLNETPEVELTHRWSSTERDSEEKVTTLKIRAKSFFKNIKSLRYFKMPVHLLQLTGLPNFESEEEKKREDLRSVAKKIWKSRWHYDTVREEWVEIFDPNKLAAFPLEIDLHIDRLVADPSKLNKSQILKKQLEVFEKYLDEAIRLGVERVFIIHGVGQGKLRDEITTRLLQTPEVQQFKNEFHPRFGWGATEVVFRK